MAPAKKEEAKAPEANAPEVQDAAANTQEAKAPEANDSKGKAEKSYKVLIPFKSKEGKVYSEGEDVSHLPFDRLKKLLDRKVIE